MRSTVPETVVHERIRGHVLHLNQRVYHRNFVVNVKLLVHVDVGWELLVRIFGVQKDGSTELCSFDLVELDHCAVSVLLNPGTKYFLLLRYKAINIYFKHNIFIKKEILEKFVHLLNRDLRCPWATDEFCVLGSVCRLQRRLIALQSECPQTTTCFTLINQQLLTSII